MVHSGLKGCFIVTIGLHEDWTNHKIKEWIKNASGTWEARVTDQTTHLVTNEKEFGKTNVIISDAMKRKEDDLQDIEIVNFDWLATSLQSKSKKREKDFRFVLSGSQVNKKNGEPGITSSSGLMKQLWEDHTLAPTAEETAIMAKKQKEEAELRVRAEEAKMKEFEASHMSTPELAALFKRGAQKAKAFLLSDNHHLYQDSTGFIYDITLTKVDTKRNTNERYSLIIQIFESNQTPSTYALSTSFSGTRLETTNHVVVAIGSSWPTVYRAFTEAFKEKTGGTWEDRVQDAHVRQRLEKAKGRMRGFAAEQLMGAGGPRRALETGTDNFQYLPPTYGPSGEGAILPGTEEEDEVPRPEFGPDDVEKFKEAVVQEEIEPFEDPFGRGLEFFGGLEEDPVLGKRAASEEIDQEGGEKKQKTGGEDS